MSLFNEFQNITGSAPINRRRALVGLSLLALTACSRSAAPTKSTDNTVAYYTCTMHPFVRSQDPKGMCPVCGMNLVAVSKASAESTPTTETGVGGIAYIAPERLQEIGATSDIIAKHGIRLGVPSRAILPTGDKFIVFLDHGDGRVEPREVQTGNPSGDYYEVISGLKEGDRVFVTANFLIDAECRIQGVLKTWGDRK